MSSNTVDIALPTRLWIAKIPEALAPASLLARHAVPTSWTDPILATGGFGGILSSADACAGIEPNVSLDGCMALPGDRIVVCSTGRRVQVLGAIVVTSVEVNRTGHLRIEHEPLVEFDRPVDLRHIRRTHALLDARWDELFGRPGRDRRLLPLRNRDVVLAFTAFGLSLEALFHTQRMGAVVVPLPAWQVGTELFDICVCTSVVGARSAFSVAAYHAARAAIERHPTATIEITSSAGGNVAFVAARSSDEVCFSAACGLRHQAQLELDPGDLARLSMHDGMEFLVAVETDRSWELLTVDSKDCTSMQGHSGESLLDAGRVE